VWVECGWWAEEFGGRLRCTARKPTKEQDSDLYHPTFEVPDDAGGRAVGLGGDGSGDDVLDVPKVVLGLAIGSGALFALQVNSNFFWMFQTLLGITTQGTVKALTLVTAMTSVVSQLLILALSLVV
jgi:GntP family permease